ncbi:LOW QUALITY PROTEIN: U4/U6.U5 tri-snRNP-associated protein 1-like [Homalodisca vitripennis]|uniref:LOW QUALITY PROTEIN: U4/U6.U5 tri-snRNP-associated protein 1-like n=1 Tax=Homalodisca vitripennis TaxID=197043 RepID=UPI001EEC1B11|nr:LOW QUALITY PROTEIN: U4/U6.U5 tri-snRNP-associated protein 1-like [Homalodisca vitripennis]
MGSHKKHKKDSKKRKHRERDRSRSGSVEEVEKEKRRHKKHHKERKKEKRPKPRSDESYESEDDDVILVPPPPPPKISRPDTPPVPPPPVISALSSPPQAPSPPRISSSSDQSLSIEETNRLRAKLGLKPLEVAQPTAIKGEEKSEKTLEGGMDMGEFVHKPADNIAAKLKSEKLKAKLAERKEKRALEAKLAKVKRLADDSDDESASAWVVKNRKITEERLKAEKKAKELDDMDAVFGVGELVEEELRSSRKEAYTARDLRGLRVEHDVDGFTEGKEIILTLKDKGVLDEEDDALVNVNLMDDERYKKNIDRRKQKPHQFGYDAYGEEEEDERSVLGKYDEEIDGEKKTSFTLGVDEMQKKKVQVKSKLQLHKRVESLVTPALQLASDYYTEQEMVKFKKPKKKVRKIRERKSKILKADDLLVDNASGGNTEDWLRELGSRRTPQVNLKPDPDNFDIDSFNTNGEVPPEAVRVKEEPGDDPMDIDDVPDLNEDLSNIKVEQDDNELEMALRKARKLKQKEAAEALNNPDKVARMVLSEEMGYGEAGPGGSIVLNSTAEFCRTLGDIPTYGLAGNRDEDAQEMLDFEREMKQERMKEESSVKRSGWNDVEMDERLVDIAQYEAPILDAEPDLAAGVAGALRLAVSKGYLEKETTKRPSASRLQHLQAQNYSIEDKAHTEDDKFGRRERYCGPTSDFKEKDGYKPNVKLDYIDDNGHVLCAKEAFRYLSHKFHGKGPGKNKVEKRMKKGEQEVLMKQMSSTDTPLGTLNMLQAKQRETQSPYVVLSGSKQLHQTASISKTKL